MVLRVFCLTRTPCGKGKQNDDDLSCLLFRNVQLFIYIYIYIYQIGLDRTPLDLALHACRPFALDDLAWLRLDRLPRQRLQPSEEGCAVCALIERLPCSHSEKIVDGLQRRYSGGKCDDIEMLLIPSA